MVLWKNRKIRYTNNGLMNRNYMMVVFCNKLCKILFINKQMSNADLRKTIGVSPNTIT